MTVDILIILIWVMLPLVWYYLMRVAGLSLFKVTIPSFVIVSFYVYQYIGFPILYFQLDPYRAQYVIDKTLMIQVFAYTSLIVTLMISGYIAANRHFGKLQWGGCTSNIHFTNNMCGRIIPGGVRQNIGLLVIVSISATVLYSYLSIVGFSKIALLVVMGSGDDINSASARSMMGNSFDGRYQWYKLFMNDLLRFAIFALFAQYLVKKNFSTRLIFILVFVLTAFVMVMAIEKGPMANLLIGLVLVSIFVKNGADVPVGKVMLFVFVLLSMLITFYVYFMGSENPYTGLLSVLSRLFTGQMQPAYHYLEFFPHYQDYLMGRSFPNPRGFFPFEHYELTKEIMAWKFPGLAAKGITGSMPTVYWGSMYANFGWLGVIIPPFFVGYLLYGLNAIVFKIQQTPLSIALIVWLLMHLKTLSGTSLTNYMLDIYMFTVVFTFISIALFAGRGVIHYRSRSRFFN